MSHHKKPRLSRRFGGKRRRHRMHQKLNMHCGARCVIGGADLER